jgi:phosphoglucomutase
MMNEQITKLREKPFKNLAGKEVKTLFDYEKRMVYDCLKGTSTKLVDPDIDVTNCLRFDFVGGGFLAIRPSGTEPKVKFYYEVVNQKDAEAQAYVDKATAELKQMMGL